MNFTEQPTAAAVFAEAPAVFAAATVEEVERAFVNTFVHVGRFTEGVAREVRARCVAAHAEKVGAAQTAAFVVACGPEAVRAVFGEAVAA